MRLAERAVYVTACGATPVAGGAGTISASTWQTAWSCLRLPANKLTEISQATVAFDALVRSYIHQHLAYRFFALSNLPQDAQRQTRELERVIRRGETPIGTPLLNPLTVRSS